MVDVGAGITAVAALRAAAVTSADETPGCAALAGRQSAPNARIAANSALAVLLNFILAPSVERKSLLGVIYYIIPDSFWIVK